GYEFQRETFISTDTAAGVFARSEASQDAHSFFVQDQMHFFEERLQISLAGRAQAYRVDDPEFQGGDAPFRNLDRFDAPPTALTADGDIAYFFPESGTKLRAHVGNGYRAPSLFNRLGTTFFLGSFSAFGDPRLRPERSISFDAGFEQTLLDERVRFSSTYFYTRLQETIVFDFSGLVDPATDPFGRFGGYANDPEGGISRGIEFETSAALSPNLEVRASYTYTNSDLTRGVEGTRFGPSLGVSDHLFTLSADYRPTPRLQLNGHLYAASDYLFRFFVPTGNRDFRFQGPVRADVGGSYRMWVKDDHKLRLYLQVENLFDDVYFENGFRTPGLTARAGIAYEY
ncbi:MAG TPA: TonB-dependent receptor, partial [Acidobacteriota bacterium]|nr:TonB-dependent receptor [Acidobacteriota bacterium]